MNNIKQKVMLAHYRVGMTDGVSLEIEKRMDILDELGYKSFLVSGPKSKNSDYVVDSLNFDSPQIASLTQRFFDQNIKEDIIPYLLEELNQVSLHIKESLRKIIETEKPDFLFLHNIFSHGRHVAASKAFLEIIEEYKIPTLGMHHDFYFERPVYANVTHPKLLEYLDSYVPPVSPYIKHAVINTMTQGTLLNRRGLKAQVITDTFDFAQKPWQKDEYNSGLVGTFSSLGISGDDITILQATRIVSRKSIEFTIQLVKYLNENHLLKDNIDKKLYNGKNITDKSKIHLLIVGYAEDDGLEYLDELKSISSGLPYIHFLSDIIHAERGFEDGQKQYSLWDCYSHVDAVSYPSTYEGWGNQFIEAVFAKLPIICYEYPVFKTDIKPFEYNYITMKDKCEKNSNYKHLKTLSQDQICKTGDKLLKCLFSKETNNLLDENFEIGQKYHSYSSLKKNLKEVFQSLNRMK
ncbi:MAG: glycosyltransferase [Spirochaetaceae bacterium]